LPINQETSIYISDHSGYFYDNDSKSKTIILTKTGNIEDLTSKILPSYYSLELQTNKENVLFEI
jgi:hypothetical protein